MSCDIRKYKSIDIGNEYEEMTITAFVGDGHSVQFSIGNSYCALNQQQVLDLIRTLTSRLMCLEGYEATGRERENILYR